MKKIIFGAVMALALSGCGKQEPDIKDVNEFLTDLSQVYLGDFKGPNPDDYIKVDFAVKRLLIDKPESFEKQGGDFAVSADKVHAVSDAYFSYPIAEDQSSNDVDFIDGKYVIMPMGDQQLSFSKATKVAQKGDTILYDVDVYNCAATWQGDRNADPQQWTPDASGSKPEKYKQMRAVLISKGDGLRVISYMVR